MDFEEILKSDEKRFADLRKIQPFEDETAGRLFKDLSKLYSEAEWFGRSIRLPNLKVLVHAPYKSQNVEGDPEASKPVRDRIEKFYQKNQVSNTAAFFQNFG